MNRVLITGASGQVGSALQATHWPDGFRFITADRSKLDLLDPAEIDSVFREVKPDILVNTAAYTAVDLAETDSEAAFATNRDGAANLARACESSGTAMIHLSTDYVFDGKKNEPYRETATTSPMSVYGSSKLAGEEAVRTILEQHIILRLSWVFGEYGSNFFRTILKLATERPELRVVDDQHGCPTYAGHVAMAITGIAEALTTTPVWGTFHYCDKPGTTWFRFATAIVNEARNFRQVATQRIEPVSSDEFPTTAPRPQYSVLDCDKLESEYGVQPQEWSAGITSALEATRRQ